MARIAVGVAFEVVLMLGFGLREWQPAAVTSVTTLPGHRPEASTSAIVSSAIARCSSVV